jgi:ribosomal protein L40E
MITCPACGKENQDSAFECKRCRAPLREDMPEEHHAEPEPAQAAHGAGVEPEASSESLGMVCRRCEAYNEPGVRLCTACGYPLFADAPAKAAVPEAQPPFDKTPPQPYAPEHVEATHDATPPDGNTSLSAELRALAISDQEAAEAGMSTSGNGAEAEPPMDRTPPHPFSLPEPEPMRAEPPARGRAEAGAASARVAAGAAVGSATSRRPPPAAPPPSAVAPVAAPAEKACSTCGANNPPAARFCFDCGTPFAKKAAPPEPKPEPPAKPPEPPPKRPEPLRAPPPPQPLPPPPQRRIEPIKAEPLPPLRRIEPIKAEPLPPLRRIEPIRAEPPPSIEVDASIQLDAALLSESTAESERVDELLADAGEPLPEELPAEEAVAAESVAESLPDEAPPPFQASLIVEKGASQGTAFMLAHLENSIGGSGAQIELSEDPFVAPHAATLLFAEDHLAVRDEGSANGVFVKVRDLAPLEAGDHFVAGERLFRYDGHVELTRNGDVDTPFLGAPRPQGNAVRVCEVLGAGKTGRTCHRAGPVIAIGRTGCDMNFPTDNLLAARHAEIRLADDGTAVVVDLGQGPSGVYLRVRAQAQQDLQGGDVLQIGDQLLRVEVG